LSKVNIVKDGTAASYFTKAIKLKGVLNFNFTLISFKLKK